MTVRRHAEVRAPASEPCPFCGCGIAIAGHAAAPRRHTGRVRYRGPAITYDELPAEWRTFARSRMVAMEMTEQERRYITAVNARAGWHAVLSHDGGSVVAWEHTETGKREGVAA